MNRVAQVSALTLLVSASSIAVANDTNDSSKKIEKITIEGRTTANDQPVGTFNMPVSNLEFDPRIDLQSRNMAEAQADVTIRGGIFENTGFRIGSATLMDPQTGHYFAEIPVAPEMLTTADVLTGADNALLGLNSSVGTVSFGWRQIKDGGSVSAGIGNNGLNLQRIHAAGTSDLSNDGWTLGFEGEFSRSTSDGSIDNGDHDYQRASGRLQLVSKNSQTDLFYGDQEKFFGWPNMYTPFNVNETEDLDTQLLMLNHRQSYGSDNNFEITAYHRQHKDHYVFSRENPSAFEAFHDTDVKSIALAGYHRFNDTIALNYASQFAEDKINSTTLERNFTSRSYTKLSVLPEYHMPLAHDEQLKIRLGLSFDDTNRDDSQTSVIGDITWSKPNSDNGRDSFYLSYSQASQVSGYTAIGGSETGGLFRSNHNLKRETSDNLELGMSLDRQGWNLDAAIFHRWDNDLADWTYSFDSTSARSANPVDIKTLGLELIAVKRFDNADIVASYTHLKKSEDYGNASVDASFYALNYPTHRITLGAIWRPLDDVELRIDNEWRTQEKNALRNGDDNALFTHLTAIYKPSQLDGLELSLSADNLWREEFEEIPGTPGRGDQYSFTATYRW
ncbi:MAG: TonB-dependent receptor plug domain-containing protein [Psychrobium sp.]